MLSQLLLPVCCSHGAVLLTDPMESVLEGRREGLECNASSVKAREELQFNWDIADTDNSLRHSPPVTHSELG